MFTAFFIQFSFVAGPARLFKRLNQSTRSSVKRGLSALVIMGLLPLAGYAAEGASTLEAQVETFNEGWKAANEGRFDDAYDTWLALSKDPISVPELNRALQNNLAVIHIKKKEYKQAEKLLDSALKADVQVAKTLANLNQIYSFQAQNAYKKVFSDAKIVWPQGEFLFFDMDKAALPTENVLTELPEYFVDGKQETKATLQVKGLLASWKEAWTSQNVTEYVSFYDKNEFTSKFGGTFEKWKKGRQRSLTRPKYIKIEFEEVQIVQLDKGLIRSRFLQKYESDRFKDNVYKIVLWQFSGEQWKIVQEVVVDGQS